MEFSSAIIEHKVIDNLKSITLSLTFTSKSPLQNSSISTLPDLPAQCSRVSPSYDSNKN